MSDCLSYTIFLYVCLPTFTFIDIVSSCGAYLIIFMYIPWFILYILSMKYELSPNVFIYQGLTVTKSCIC